jgi:type I restriction enzyme M protein
LASEVVGQVGDWFATHRPMLQAIDQETVPSQLIATIGDDLIARFKNAALLDEYDVYEQLMTYWHDVMHDDVFLIMNEGWMDAAKPRKTIEDRDRKLSETPDLVIGSGRGAAKYKMDLIPPALIVARYFAKEQAEVDKLSAAAEEASRAVEEYVEEHAVEDGLLAEAMDDDGKVTKTLAAARLKKAKRERADADEIAALERLIKLYDAEAVAKTNAKAAQAGLDEATLRQYGKLRLPEIKQLVLDDKWHTTIAGRIASEIDSLTLKLAFRIQELGERYADTVGDLEAELAQLSSRVTQHLADMGVQ